MHLVLLQKSSIYQQLHWPDTGSFDAGRVELLISVRLQILSGPAYHFGKVVFASEDVPLIKQWHRDISAYLDASFYT
jgi:hypothetical protein